MGEQRLKDQQPSPILSERLLSKGWWHSGVETRCCQILLTLGTAEEATQLGDPRRTACTGRAGFPQHTSSRQMSDYQEGQSLPISKTHGLLISSLPL